MREGDKVEWESGVRKWNKSVEKQIIVKKWRENARKRERERVDGEGEMKNKEKTKSLFQRKIERESSLWKWPSEFLENIKIR